MFTLSLNEHIEKLSEEELNTYITCKTNEIYKKRIVEIIQSNCCIYISFSSFSSTSDNGLYNAAEVIEFFSSSMRYDNPIKDLLIFRDNYHSKLKSLILNSSSHHEKSYYYEYSIDNNYEKIIKAISILIDELITFRNKVYYTVLPSEVLKNKKEELLRYISNLSN